MNDTQRVLIELLNAAIHKESFKGNYKAIQWNNVIEEAGIHNIKALTYSALNQDSKRLIDNKTLTLWRQDAFCKGIAQRNYLREVIELLDKFNKENITVLCLNDLIIRALYPTQEMRVINKAVLLVKDEEKLERIIEKLKGVGYIESDVSSEITTFVREGHITIELRKSICDNRYYKGNISKWQKRVWDNTIGFKINEVDIESLSWEDVIISLLLEMNSNVINKTLDIQQLADIVLAIEKKGDQIQWGVFKDKIQSCGLEKFTFAIFNLCNKIFNLEIPQAMNFNKETYIKYSDMILDQIFIIKNEENKEETFIVGMWKRILSIFKKTNRTEKIISNEDELNNWI